MPVSDRRRERWRDVPGFVGLYQASDQGRIRSVDRTLVVPSRWGLATRFYPGRVLRRTPDTAGYPQVTLCNRLGKHQRRVHRLITLAFRGPPPPGHEVLHRNGKKTDCRLANLRYGTSQENKDDRSRHGATAIGERHGLAKLTAAKVRKIRKLLRRTTQAVVARRYGTGRQTIADISRGKTWRHIA